MVKKDDKELRYERPTLNRLDEAAEGQLDCENGSAAVTTCAGGNAAAGAGCSPGGTPAG